MNFTSFTPALLITTSVFLAGCARTAANAGAQAPPPAVEITSVSPGVADIFAEYPAQTYARNQVEIRGRVEGYIEKWLFHPGEEVKVGQPLYILDLRPF